VVAISRDEGEGSVREKGAASEKCTEDKSTLLLLLGEEK
jgi:hypothetical protein